VRGSNASKAPARKPGARYTSGSYYRAIAEACARAFPPHAELGRIRVARRDGKKGGRLETAKEWKARLGKEWPKLTEWVEGHRWHPNQLRHTAATRLRREFGIDVAQSILGHRLGSNVTEVYAEVDAAKLAGIVERIG
jgi:integrase